MFTVFATAVNAQEQEQFTVGNLTYTVTSPTTVELTKLDNKVKDAVTIPEKVTSKDSKQYTVTSIGEEACKWSDAVSISVPETVDSIKKSAFSGTKLTSFSFPKKLRYIGPYAFSSTKLISVEIPATVEVISDHAFFGTNSVPTLTSVKLHEGPNWENPSSCVTGHSRRLSSTKVFYILGKVPSTTVQHWQNSPYRTH